MATQETILLTDTEYQPAYGALYGNQRTTTHNQDQQVIIDMEGYSNHDACKNLQKIDYLCNAWEDYKAKQGATPHREETFDCTDSCIEAYGNYYNNSPAVRVRLKMLDTINMMISSISRNLLHASVREAIVYLSLVAMLPFFALSIAIYITDDNKLPIEKNWTKISISFNVVGLLFTCLDVGLYFCHHGYRLIKKIWNGESLVQPMDEEEVEFCKGLACQGMCGRGWVGGMDIIRIIVLTIFYTNLILIKMFKFIVLHECPNEITSLDWASAVISLFCIIEFIYMKKAYVFAKMFFLICDICRITKEKTKATIFFVFYMLGIMFLQVLMAVTFSTVTRFYEVYTDPESKDVPKVWIAWYMIILSLFMFAMGILNFSSSHHYWTTRVPVNIVYDGIAVLHVIITLLTNIDSLIPLLVLIGTIYGAIFLMRFLCKAYYKCL